MEAIIIQDGYYYRTFYQKGQTYKISDNDNQHFYTGQSNGLMGLYVSEQLRALGILRYTKTQETEDLKNSDVTVHPFFKRMQGVVDAAYGIVSETVKVAAIVALYITIAAVGIRFTMYHVPQQEIICTPPCEEVDDASVELNATTQKGLQDFASLERRVK